MQYLEYMINLRHALRVVSEKLPQVMNVAKYKAETEADQDLKIALLPDMEFYILQKKCEEDEEKLYRFNPEDEYGKVNTMWAEDMRGSEL